ncbi:MAG TPA: hypothetical protein VF198_00800 [Vicinamibacterales bacterium]
MASSSDGTTRPSPRSMTVRVAVTGGWRRAAGAWLAIAGILAATALATLPATLLLARAIEHDLGASLMAERAAGGADLVWWDEFQYRGAPPSFTPGIIGGAAPLTTYSGLLDGATPPPEALAAAVVAGAVWLFLSGGLLERLARRRRLGTRGFLAGCGALFFRLLRMAVITGVLYALLLGPVHGWIFDGLYPWLTRETTVERTAAVWRATLYLLWLAPLLAVNLLADYAKVRLVIEDRRSVLGALAAAARFLRRHAGSAIAVYAVNGVAAGLVLLLYLVIAPGGTGGDWRLLAVLAAGVGYLAARLFVRAAFLGSAMTLFEGRLAHAAFTAPPVPIWPDSPAAEAIDNAART